MKKVVTPAHHVLFHLKLSMNKNVPPSCHLEKALLIKLGEIIGVNPNSYETVKQVSLNLLEQAGIPQKRKWMRVVRYRTVADLIENMKQCTICNALP